MGQHFWYDAYSSSLDVILGSLNEIPSKKGSVSADVVLQNYLSDSRPRKLRREVLLNPSTVDGFPNSHSLSTAYPRITHYRGLLGPLAHCVRSRYSSHPY